MAEDAVQTHVGMDLEADVELTNKERFFYSSGVIGVIIPFMLPLAFLSFFWTDIVKIPAAAVGTFMMLCKLWDAVNDPIIGGIVDRSYSPKGRYRQWLIPMGCITNVLCVLLFVKLPGELGPMQYLLSFGVYFFFFASYTWLEVPHLSLMSTITTNYKQRGILTSWRQTFASFMMMICNFSFLRIVNLVGGGEANATGYLAAAFIFCAVSLPFYFICTAGIKERVIPSREEVNVPLAESLKCIKGNWPAIALMGCMVSLGFSAGFGVAGMHFWQYYVGDLMQSATNSTLTSAVSLLAGPLMILLMKWIPNKRNLGVLGWTISISLAVVRYFIPVGHEVVTPWALPLFHALTALGGMFGQISLIVIFSLQPDVSEYTKVKYGLRANGFIVAISYFFWKAGIAFTQGVYNWVLGGMNFVPGGYGSQPAAIITWIRLCMQILPAAIQVFGIVAFMFYKLDEKTHEEALRQIASTE